MSKMPEDNLLQSLTSNLGDYRYNPVSLVHRLQPEPAVIHNALWDTIISYIYMQARRYEMGLVRADQYEIVRVCKKIKDLALEDEFSHLPEYKYGELPKPVEYISV